MLFFDTETDHYNKNGVDHHYMKLGWSCYVERSLSGGVKQETWNYHETNESILSLIDRRAYPGTTLYLLGHNVFFDLMVSGFFPYFTAEGWELDFYYDAGLTFILSIKKGRRKIRALSTTNYFSFSLEDLGKVLGLPKGNVDFDSVTLSDLSEYCRRDTEITEKAFLFWLDFIQEHDLGRFGLTKSSQAFNAYRHRFMDKNIFIHSHSSAVDLERSAYMGGRTESFFIGKAKGSPFLSLDINSMYPYLMKTQSLPTRLIRMGDSLPLETAGRLLSSHAIIARVKVKTPIPCFAYRTPGKVIYPCGEYWTHVCSSGLSYGLARGLIEEIGEYALYEKDKIFSSYVDYFYALKARYHVEGNSVFRSMSKYYMNTLYGKFGQRRKIEDRLQEPDERGFFREEILDLPTRRRYVQTHLFNVCLTTYHETNGKNTFVAIPAHITEAGRMLLWEIIESFPQRSVLYCDTDSVKIPAASLPHLTYPVNETDLGALSVESRLTALTLYGCKDYDADGEIKLKGVPRSAKPLGPDVYSYDQFSGFYTHLKERNMDTFMVKRVIKHLTRTYDKALVGSDGWTIPFNLPDDVKLLS